MTNETREQLLNFLDREFGKRPGYANPKVIFRSRDVVVGTAIGRCPTLTWTKSAARIAQSRTRVMARVICEIVDNGGYIGGYRIQKTQLNTSRGTRFIATRPNQTVIEHDRHK